MRIRVTLIPHFRIKPPEYVQVEDYLKHLLALCVLDWVLSILNNVSACLENKYMSSHMKSSATWKMCWTVVQNDPLARLSKTIIFTVNGLFEKPSELKKRRSRYDIYKRIEASYYGYRDDEDGVLEKVERGAEERMRAESVECQNHQNSLNSRFLLAGFLLPCYVVSRSWLMILRHRPHMRDTCSILLS
nr:pre-mRNA-splicing factor ISY1 homolog [Tanacetum cinerariifolium]